METQIHGALAAESGQASTCEWKKSVSLCVSFVRLSYEMMLYKLLKASAVKKKINKDIIVT